MLGGFSVCACAYGWITIDAFEALAARSACNYVCMRY